MARPGQGLGLCAGVARLIAIFEAEMPVATALTRVTRVAQIDASILA